MSVSSWAWVWELAKCQAQGITFQAGANSDRHHLFLGVGKEASKKNECECAAEENHVPPGELSGENQTKRNIC